MSQVELSKEFGLAKLALVVGEWVRASALRRHSSPPRELNYKPDLAQEPRYCTDYGPFPSFQAYIDKGRQGIHTVKELGVYLYLFWDSFHLSGLAPAFARSGFRCGRTPTCA